MRIWKAADGFEWGRKGWSTVALLRSSGSFGCGTHDEAVSTFAPDDSFGAASHPADDSFGAASRRAHDSFGTNARRGLQMEGGA